MAKIKTKARALDLLGRQQIAGIPTALSELFKNAHDAYADNVEVDYIQKQNLLILRDDGMGMTREEFVERWLTIGTDSKLDDEDSIETPSIDSSKPKRSVMGEKGVGRLSIAAIGPQVLVLTRAKRPDGLHRTVAAFINWTLFGQPRLDLEDIEIPIIEVESGRNISSDEVEGLTSLAKENIVALEGKLSDRKLKHLKEQVDAFQFDPYRIYPALESMDLDINQVLQSDSGSCKRNLSLAGDGFGTHFVISPVDEVLADDIAQSETRRTTDQSSRLEKALLGFTNTMYQESKPPIYARFRDHQPNGECVDRISESIFFTAREFEKADHHFSGRFDEFGQFSGDISIYDENKTDYVVPWSGGRNKETLCGPFRIKLAYVQGRERDTKLPPEDWRLLSNKTDRIGGLYVYRDGIRVLPYGDSDFDFLRIEQRRSKHASQYYFSYRRMFGAIELTKEQNSILEEKAGREGFIENKAYKQLKAILENFFIQVAADFFRDAGEMSDLFHEQRRRRQEEYDLLKKRQKNKTEKKTRLKESLEKFFVKTDEGRWEKLICESRVAVDKMFDVHRGEQASLDELVFSVEERLRQDVEILKAETSISRPSGMGFGKEITGLLDKYQVEVEKINDLIDEYQDYVSARIIEYQEVCGDRVGLKRRFNDSISTQIEYQKKALDELYVEVQKDVDQVKDLVSSALSESRELAKSDFDKVRADMARIDIDKASKEDVLDLKRRLEKQVFDSSKSIMKKLEDVSSQLGFVKSRGGVEEINSARLTEVIETEYEYLKEQSDDNAEMVQLGMALSVIHHEFNGNIRSIKSGLRELQPWAKKNPKLKVITDKIRIGFEHLEGYLNTFTPLTRRLSRKRIEITGQAIKEFLQDVFYERIEKEGVQLKFADGFLTQSVNAYTSTLFPAFVNLIDNALHWLGKSTGEKVITFGWLENGFYIEDSGPGVPSIDQENVFEFGFTRRVGGRGMGLYVTRQTLERDGFIIELDEYKPEKGARFNIYKRPENEEVQSVEG